MSSDKDTIDVVYFHRNRQSPFELKEEEVNFPASITFEELIDEAREIFGFIKFDLHQYENTSQSASYVVPIGNKEEWDFSKTNGSGKFFIKVREDLDTESNDIFFQPEVKSSLITGAKMGPSKITSTSKKPITQIKKSDLPLSEPAAETLNNIQNVSQLPAPLGYLGQARQSDSKNSFDSSPDIKEQNKQYSFQLSNASVLYDNYQGNKVGGYNNNQYQDGNMSYVELGQGSLQMAQGHFINSDDEYDDENFGTGICQQSAGNNFQDSIIMGIQPELLTKKTMKRGGSNLKNKPLENDSMVMVNKPEEEQEILKRVPSLEEIMTALGKTVIESDEISIPQLSTMFSLWLKENLAKASDTKSQQLFIQESFMPLFANLIRSVHKAPEGGAHLVCHEQEIKHDQEDEKLPEEDLQDVNLHEECLKNYGDLDQQITQLQGEKANLQIQIEQAMTQIQTQGDQITNLANENLSFKQKLVLEESKLHQAQQTSQSHIQTIEEIQKERDTFSIKHDQLIVERDSLRNERDEIDIREKQAQEVLRQERLRGIQMNYQIKVLTENQEHLINEHEKAIQSLKERVASYSHFDINPVAICNQPNVIIQSDKETSFNVSSSFMNQGQNSWPSGLVVLKRIYTSSENLSPEHVLLEREVQPNEVFDFEITLNQTPQTGATIIYQLALVLGDKLIHYFGPQLTIKIQRVQEEAKEEVKEEIKVGTSLLSKKIGLGFIAQLTDNLKIENLKKIKQLDLKVANLSQKAFLIELNDKYGYLELEKNLELVKKYYLPGKNLEEVKKVILDQLREPHVYNHVHHHTEVDERHCTVMENLKLLGYNDEEKNKQLTIKILQEWKDKALDEGFMSYMLDQAEKFFV